MNEETSNVIEFAAAIAALTPKTHAPKPEKDAPMEPLKASILECLKTLERRAHELRS